MLEGDISIQCYHHTETSLLVKGAISHTHTSSHHSDAQKGERLSTERVAIAMYRLEVY